MNKRFWEIDALRGIAIVMMAIFHFFFDLNYFGLLQNSMYEGAWLVFQRTIASLFILLVGVSLSISHAKAKDSWGCGNLWVTIRRALVILAIAMIITAVTWIYPNKGFIFFGILHFIGISIMLAIPFLSYRYLNLFLGTTLVFVGLYNSTRVTWDIPTSLLGFILEGVYTLDFYPLLPWFGIILIGVAMGNILYSNGKRQFRLIKFSGITKSVGWLGQRSLMIYLVHQPVIIAIIMAYMFLVK